MTSNITKTANGSKSSKSNQTNYSDINFQSVNSKQISWIPFVLIGILLSGIAAIAINYGSTSSELLVIGGAIGMVIVIAIFQKPELGTYLIIFTVFTNLSDLFTEKGLPSINKPLVGILILSILAHSILRTGRISPFPKLTRIEYSVITYCIVVIISYYVAINPDRSQLYILDLIKDIIILFCILITLNTREKWVAGANVLLLAITFVSLLGVIHSLTGSDETFWGFAQQSAFGQTDNSGELRFGGPIGESNIWGQVLVSIIPFAIYRFAKAKTIASKTVFAFSSILILLSVLYTQSRGAFLALAVVVVLTMIEMRIRGPVLVALAVVGIAFLFLIPSKYTERIRTLDIFFQTNQNNSYSIDESFVGRKEKMLTGLAMFRDNPILGVGFANYTDNYWNYAGNLGLEASARNLTSERALREPHSLYIEILAETGLLGILAFLLFFGLIMKNIYQIRKTYRTRGSAPNEDWSAWITSTGISILTFLVAGFFLHGIGFRFIWVLAGMALSAINISKNKVFTNQLMNTK
jgi:O-antigen ligase